MEAEYGEDSRLAMMAAADEEEGWQTPRREDCRIPAVLPCPGAPKRKTAVSDLDGSGSKLREPPKGGYYKLSDIESLFVRVPPRRHRAASTCA